MASSSQLGTIRSMSGVQALESRVDELEVHAAFTAKTVEDLDGVVREFSLRVQRLEQELRELRGQLEAMASTPPADFDED